jgi:ABC-type dipeptide/oligopeptide/nickel transport system ATPase subunit
MLIGINGEAGSGKDTVYSFIELWAQADGVRLCRRDAFADRLKISAARALGMVSESPEECIDFCNRLKEPGGRVEAFIPTEVTPA